MEFIINYGSDIHGKEVVSIKSVAKKVIVCSLLGLLQVGLFAPAADAAAPKHKPQRYEHRAEYRNDHHQRELKKEKERRLKEENKRHEKIMKRHPFESTKQWHERQKKEIERHRRAVYEIMQMGRR